MISSTLSFPLQNSLWTGALNAGDALRRSGVAMRRLARQKLLALRPAGRPSDPAAEAAAVRELAATYAKSDRGFAADLYAAAARHEAAGGV